MANKKIYTTAYKLGMLNVHNSTTEKQRDTYKELLLELMKEIKDKDLHLK